MHPATVRLGQGIVPFSRLPYWSKIWLFARMHLEIRCEVSIGIHINLLLSLRRGGAMNGYLGLELRVHAARVDHIVSNKVR